MPLEDVFDVHEGKTRMNTTVRHYMRLISSMFTTAIQWKYLTDNPDARVGLPKMDSAEQIVLTLEEAQQMAEQGLEWSDDDCVFDKANDKRNNLPDIHLHDLRRTAATLMIGEQCPITAVAGTLGHATPATTTTTPFSAPASRLPT